MIIFKEIRALQQHLSIERQKGKKTGFVPTMGALHQGHISLVQQSKATTDITICSIFVNPTQFNDPKDFEKYPVTIARDILLLEQSNTDILFLPSVEEMYPNGQQSTIHYNLGYLETILEGAYRPGHFQGVCQVVHRLLDIVQPHTMFLGQKDYQQCMVLKRLVALFDIPVQIAIGETVRETSGLAMSSRNLRLNDDQKVTATTIYAILQQIKTDLPHASFARLEERAVATLLSAGFEKVDYVTIAAAGDLSIPAAEQWDGRTPLVALVAAFLGGVRLIDNKILQ